MRPDDLIRDLSRRQHGVMHRRQLADAGVRPEVVYRRIASGSLVVVSPVVLRLAGSPVTSESDDLAATLDLGSAAVLSHWSAASRWGLPVGRPQRSHVSGQRNRNRRSAPLGIVHEPRSLLAAHTTTLGPTPITTPARTLFDIANLRGVHPQRLERLVDAALSSRLVTIDRLYGVLRTLPTRGRRGTAVMRSLIAERRGSPPVESGLEFRFAALARQAGLRGLERQVDLGDGAEWIGRVDFVDRSRTIVIECDSERFHGSLTARRDDALRRRRLEAAGWTVITFSEVDIWHRGDAVVSELQQLLRAQRYEAAG